MQVSEFVFYDHSGIDLPLPDDIFVTKNPQLESTCLVSNHPSVDAHMVAPEIDLYLKNSKDDVLTKATNVSKLFEARALCFDFAQDSDYFQEVGKNILLVGEEEQLSSLKSALKEREYAVVILHPSEISMIEGHLGALHVSVGEDSQIDADQMIWFEAPEFAMRQSGVLSPENSDIEAIIEEIESKTGSHQYKNYITYDPSICQYHERREEICGKCAEVCPTVAIVKFDDTKHLKFSHIDCVGCGGCISVCPSGAVEYAQMPRAAFYEIAKLYEDKIPLIIPRKMFKDDLHVSLPENVLPLAIEGEKYLHEAHFLTLLQESGSTVVFYTDFISKGTGDVIKILNQAYQKVYGKDAIHVAMNPNELEDAILKAGFVEGSRHGINEDGLAKREIFSARLAWMVGEKDYGTIQSGEHVRYGNVEINEANCTLCLSCVGACNVRALTAHPEDNSLRFNGSICTACGYCEVTCPENDCLTLNRGSLHLNKSWFGQKIMAKDTLFECVMCGKPFATTKAIERIASVMGPIFGNNEVKKKSLYCCADCKPKLMFESFLEEREKTL
jgi:ferredoxin